MPELDVLPGGLLPPVQDRLGVVGEPVLRSRTDHTPTLLTQPAEVGRRADVGAHGDDPCGRPRAPARVRSSRVRPSAAWVVAVPLGVRPMSVGTASGRLVRHREPAQPLRRSAAHSAAARAAPRRSRATGRRDRRRAGRPSSTHLLLGQQRRVVLRVALGRQTVALDRVGEDHRRPGVVDRRERVVERTAVVAAEVARSHRASCWSSRPAISPAIASAPAPAPGSRRRSSAASQRSSRWYSGLVISSIRAAAPRRRAGRTAPRSSCPYLTVMTCHPAAANMPAACRRRCWAPRGPTTAG